MLCKTLNYLKPEPGYLQQSKVILRYLWIFRSNYISLSWAISGYIWLSLAISDNLGLPLTISSYLGLSPAKNFFLPVLFFMSNF